MSTATLYTTEMCIQHIQGSHKQRLLLTLTLSAKATLLLSTPPLTSPTVNQGPADLPIITHLTNLIPPSSIASNQQLSNVAQACPAFMMSNPAIKLAEPACLWSRATLPRKMLHGDCLPLCRFILYLVW
jgi:hypothetical protein